MNKVNHIGYNQIVRLYNELAGTGTEHAIDLISEAYGYEREVVAHVVHDYLNTRTEYRKISKC